MVETARGSAPSREQLVKLEAATRRIFESQDDDNVHHLIPEQASTYLIGLSKSGVSKENKRELAEKARNVWEAWRINFNDIKCVRKRNGNKKHIGNGGQAAIYLARMKTSDENEDIEVAVKDFSVKRSEAKDQFPVFIPEVFLQIHGAFMYPQNALRFLEDEDEPFIYPYIVMELMAYDLNQAQDKKLLKTLESKLRILRDVAEGIAHLHSRGIDHRDIKPENVLVNIADSRIIGKAKLCDFGLSINAEETGLSTDEDKLPLFTRTVGTTLHMSPKSHNSSIKENTTRARDIWSLSVLICAVLIPDFIENILRNDPEELDEKIKTDDFAKESAERVRTILGFCCFVPIVGPFKVPTDSRCFANIDE